MIVFEYNCRFNWTKGDGREINWLPIFVEVESNVVENVILDYVYAKVINKSLWLYYVIHRHIRTDRKVIYFNDAQ